MIPEIFSKIVLSLALGALVGIEREKRGKGELVAGIRTFMLVSLLGTLSGYFSQILNSTIIIAISLFLVGALTVLGYLSKVRRKHLGITTEIAFILTFIIGLVIFFDSYPYFLSVSLSILLTFILVSKSFSHKFAKHLTDKEIWDAIIFGIVTFIILPLLPRTTIDPFNSINPFVIWLSIVIILGVSFFGYIAMKVFGPRKGLPLAGFLGGLASSTAVTIDMAQKVKTNKKIFYSAIFTVVLASSAKFLRMIAISFIFNTDVALKLFLPLVILSTSGFVLSLFSWKKVSHDKTSVSIKSPLALGSTLKYGLFFVVILFFSNLAKNFLGASALLIIAPITGLVDVDAITISFSSLAATGLSPTVAALGILLAGLSSIASKWFLSRWIGNKSMGMEVGKYFSILLLIGILSLVLIAI
jgi:uncharacterized membrane protein (DUF4010 family)